MADQADLLPGTLDLLILKAVSLGALHGYGVLLRIEQITHGALLVEQGRSIPRCIAWSTRGCSIRSGAPPTTTAAPSTTRSPRPGVGACVKRPTAGIGWSAPCRWP